MMIDDDKCTLSGRPINEYILSPWTIALPPYEKATKLYRELNNGRLAMIGLFSLISEAWQVPIALST
eukprot:5603010-Karenia_brevis.AAC.1